MNVSVGDVFMHRKREKGKNKSVYSCLISMHFIFDAIATTLLKKLEFRVQQF